MADILRRRERHLLWCSFPFGFEALDKGPGCYNSSDKYAAAFGVNRFSEVQACSVVLGYDARKKAKQRRTKILRYSFSCWMSVMLSPLRRIRPDGYSSSCIPVPKQTRSVPIERLSFPSF
jgi:hypothetical protein